MEALSPGHERRRTRRAEAEAEGHARAEPSVPGVQTPNKPDALGLVDDHARHCLKDPRRADEHADELMDAVGRMLSR